MILIWQEALSVETLTPMRWKATVDAKEYSFTVLFEPAEEGGYVVTCPALPGLVTEGDTLEEAREMAKDAIRIYLESLQKDGQSIPPDKAIREEPVKEKVKVVLETI
jgi:predicted RNase H-like HicB family nuclease